MPPFRQAHLFSLLAWLGSSVVDPSQSEKQDNGGVEAERVSGTNPDYHRGAILLPRAHCDDPHFSLASV
jgi:hypothetical protein